MKAKLGRRRPWDLSSLLTKLSPRTTCSNILALNNNNNNRRNSYGQGKPAIYFIVTGRTKRARCSFVNLPGGPLVVSGVKKKKMNKKHIIIGKNGILISLISAKPTIISQCRRAGVR